MTIIQFNAIYSMTDDERARLVPKRFLREYYRENIMELLKRQIPWLLVVVVILLICLKWAKEN